jgi:hypothetical protein
VIRRSLAIVPMSGASQGFIGADHDDFKEEDYLGGLQDGAVFSFSPSPVKG